MKVKSELLAVKLYFQIELVKKKSILYPCLDNVLTVAFNIVVPVYIEKGDILFIQGEKICDIWYGHVQSVDKTNKTVNVYFYIKGRRHACLVRETQGK